LPFADLTHYRGSRNPSTPSAPLGSVLSLARTLDFTEKTMKRVLVLVALLLSPMLLSGQVTPAATGRGGGGGRGGNQPQPPAELTSRGGGTCAENVAEQGQPPRWEVVQKWNCANEPNPLPAINSVWMEEMTWMDVRDALAAGKTTVIIATGGFEPNGPFLALGKHNYVLQANCEAIARRLGNALCAPVVKFVPEGPVDGGGGHMASPGTISLSNETYRAMLSEIARNMKAHGFRNIIMIGDSGGNGSGMEAVAAALKEQWKGDPVIAHVPEHYEYSAVSRFMRENGFVVGSADDNLHDDPIITLNMYANDPESISWSRRMAAGLTTINGVSVADPVKNAELAAKVVDFRASFTIEGIRKAIAYGGTVPEAADDDQPTGGRAAGAGRAGGAGAPGRPGGPGGF
jgi:creatinine amidohydrolase/Fe(II)-dependent formamide hydrolase-like protein